MDEATKEELVFWTRTMVEHDIQDGDLDHAKSLINKYDGLAQSKKLANIYVERAKDSLDELAKHVKINENISHMLKSLPAYILARLS